MSLLKQVKERLNTDANRASDSRVRDEARAVEPVSRTKHPYDPRPDLPDPESLWKTVLATCYGVWGMCELYGLLQGLRILGCRIEREGEELKLRYGPALEVWDKEVLMREWLRPNAQGIKDVFERADAQLRGLEPGRRTPSWMRSA